MEKIKLNATQKKVLQTEYKKYEDRKNKGIIRTIRYFGKEYEAMVEVLDMAERLEEELHAEDEVNNKYGTWILIWFWDKYREQEGMI